eukprot:2762990-Prymnesium_polylepis.1
MTRVTSVRAGYSWWLFTPKISDRLGSGSRHRTVSRERAQKSGRDLHGIRSHKFAGGRTLRRGIAMSPCSMTMVLIRQLAHSGSPAETLKR